MTIAAQTGTILQYRANSLGGMSTGSANQNPEPGPISGIHGTALLDARGPFTYKPGQGFNSATYVFLGGGKYQCLDQVPTVAADNNICASQSPGATAALTLVSSSGAGVTVGVSISSSDTLATVTGLLALDTAMGSVLFGQTGVGSINMWDPTKAVARNIRITSGGNDSGITFTVTGYDLYGYPMSEAITGANAGIASGVKAFKYVSGVTHTGSVATTVKVGTGDVFGLPIRADRMPYVEAWWGNPQSMIGGPGGTVSAAEQTFIIPIVSNLEFANSAVFKTIVPFGFTLKSAAYIVGTPVTTGSKLATLTMQVNGTSVGTGGVIALTSAGMTPTGTVIPATTISGTGITSNTASQAVTITIASPGVVTWNNHGLTAGTPVVFTSSGALPTGLTAGTNYYVISAGLTTNAFEVSATLGGSAVNTSGTQSGIQTATALTTVGFVASAVTAFAEGDGYVEMVVTNNELQGGIFTAAVTTSPATTTTGDVRGTLAVPTPSDGQKRLTMWIAPSVANIEALTGTYGVTQNLSTNGG